MKQSKIAKLLIISGLVLVLISAGISIYFRRSPKRSINVTVPTVIEIEPEANDQQSPAEKLVAARDLERKLDIDALNEALRGYFAANRTYPTNQDMNSQSFRELKLVGLEDNHFADPQDNASFSLIVGGPQSKSYAYDVRTSSGSSCSNSSFQACVSYRLTAWLEGGGTYEVDSGATP